MMLLHAILSVLGVSVLSDIKLVAERAFESYTIFTWEDGATISRIINLSEYRIIHGLDSRAENAFEYVNGDVHLSFYLLRPGNTFWGMKLKAPMLAVSLPFYSCSTADAETRRRIVWLVYLYLDGMFSEPALFCDDIDGSVSSNGLQDNFASKMNYMRASGAAKVKSLTAGVEDYQPSCADSYESVVYESNQMSKSLFLLKQDDFLKTIGRK